MDRWVIKHRVFKPGSGVRVPEEVKEKTQDFHPGNACLCPGSTTLGDQCFNPNHNLFTTCFGA